MNEQLSIQAVRLVYSALLGIGIGILYDIIRTISLNKNKCAGTILEIICCIFAAAIEFIFMMKSSSGRTGLWPAAAAAGTFVVYEYSCRGIVVELISLILEKIKKFNYKIEKILKKLVYSAKNLFINMR